MGPWPIKTNIKKNRKHSKQLSKNAEPMDLHNGEMVNKGEERKILEILNTKYT